MGILQAAAAAGGLYLFLHLYLIPKLHRSLPEARGGKVYSAVVGLLLSEVLHGAALVIGLSLALAAATIWALSNFSGYGSQRDMARIFEGLRWTHDVIEQVSTWWGILTIACLSLALWIAIKREAQQRVASGFNKALEKLKADAEADRIPDMPSTPEMSAIEQMIEERRTKATRILEEAEARGEGNDKIDPEKNDELAELLSQIETLKTNLMNIDVMRRLDVGTAVATDAKIDGNPSKNSLFLSTGFFNLISGATRVLAIISLALLAPSLLAISSPEIANATLQAQIRVHDVILKSTASEAEKAWAQHLNSDGKDHELSADDKKLIDDLASLFSRYSIQVNQAIVSTPSNTGRALVQAAVRERIVRDFATARGGAAPPRNAAVLESTLAAHTERAALPGDVRESLRAELTQQARAAKSEAWEAFKAKATPLVKSASVPISSEQLAPKLLNEVMNSAWKAASGGDSPHVFKMLAAELIEPGELTQRSREIFRLNQHRFLNSIATTGQILPIQDALQVAPNIPAHDVRSVAELREVSRKLTSRIQTTQASFGMSPPTLTVQDRSGANLATARAHIEGTLKTRSAVELRRGLPQTLATYADYFPGVHGEELRTPRANLVSATPALKAANSQTATEVRTNFARARSYGGLRGFAKVGGVLIGLSPSSDEKPKIVDMTWIAGDDGVRIALTRQDNKILSFGPFRAEIIRLAMAYAADGRLVAVTMPADPDAGRKILLHPALVDTALGCEARQLDQFVDQFTARRPEREAAELRVRYHMATYQYAWATRFKILAHHLNDRVPADLLNNRIQFAEHILSHPGMQGAVEATINTRHEWSDSKLSPITTKLDYLERNLVGTIGICLPKSTDAASFGQCIAEALLPATFIDSGHWVYEPPVFFSESGVRELPYSLDADLDFLRFDNKGHPTWPFKFMVQVTFESPRHFAASADTTFDEEPFEYPALQPWLNRQVSMSMNLSRDRLFDAPRIFADLREFTMLQRFFRLALDGKLGERFPVEALLELKDVAPRTTAPQVRTPVWNNPHATLAWLKQNGLSDLAEPLGVASDLRAEQAGGPSCPAIKP